LFNIIIHIINSILVFLLVRKLFLTSIITSSRLRNHTFNISLFTALIFAVHPIQVQAVTYITQRMVSLAVMFYLLSVFFYITGRLENRKRLNPRLCRTKVSMNLHCGSYDGMGLFVFRICGRLCNLRIRSQNGIIPPHEAPPRRIGLDLLADYCSQTFLLLHAADFGRL